MKRLLRAIFSAKALVVVGALAAGVALLLAAFHAIENWRGDRDWNAYRAAAAARGVKLGLDALATDPIPDAENFAAIPLFEEIFAAEDGADISNIGLNAMPRFREKAEGSSKSQRQPIDLAGWRDVFVEKGIIEPSNASPAIAVLRALEHYEPLLAQLQTATQRPLTRFPAEWHRGFGVKFPHFRPLGNAAIALSVRCAANLEIGNQASALFDLQSLLRLYRAIENEPVVLFGLLRCVMLTQLENAVWSGIARQQWQADALRELQTELCAIDLQQDYRVVLRGERALVNVAIDNIVAGRSAINTVDSAWRYSYWLPHGWIRQGQCFINELFDAKLARLEQPARAWMDEELTTTRMREIQDSTWRRHCFARTLFTIPDFPMMDKVYLKHYTRCLQTAVACALARHFLVTASYPETLDMLERDLLSSTPIDIVDGSPLRYRRVEGGSYVLWSIGANRRDDKGSIDPNLSWDDQLDWIWQP